MINLFTDFEGVLAAVSEKSDGLMSFKREEGGANRRAFYQRLGVAQENMVSAGLVHGNSVALVRDAQKQRIEKTDALITAAPGIFLSLTVADCFPLFLYEPEKRIVALVHAGWRGVHKNILRAVIEQIKKIGCNASVLRMAIGPGIRACCFEVSRDVAETFNARDAYVRQDHGRFFIDLPKILKQQFSDAGGDHAHIEEYPGCTFDESDRFFSFRREKISPPRTMVAALGMR